MHAGMKRLPPKPLAESNTGGKNLFELEEDASPPLELDLEGAPARPGHSYIRPTSSTPPPFEAISEDAMDAWTENQMWLTSTLISLDLELQRVPQHPAVGPTTEWIRALLSSFGLLKDALFDLLTDAMACAPLTSPDSTLMHELRHVYRWASVVLDATVNLVQGLQRLQPDWGAFRSAVSARRSFLNRRTLNAVLRSNGILVGSDPLLPEINRRTERVYFEALWIERDLSEVAATTSSRPSPP
jgi:hypothetical protein